MYKCSECKSIARAKPNTYHRLYYNSPPSPVQYEASCVYCGAHPENIISHKNTSFDVSSIDYAFPPFEWPNHRERFMGYLNTHPSVHSMLPTLCGYTLSSGLAPRAYLPTYIDRILHPMPMHNWKFNFKLSFLIDHPEFRMQYAKLSPTNDIICKFNNSFYAYITQSYLLDLIFSNSLNDKQTLTPVANKCIWTLDKTTTNLTDYFRRYASFVQDNEIRWNT